MAISVHKGNHNRNSMNFTTVDLYCGCGGVTEGLKQSGFKVLAAVDNDLVACRSYKKNHPEVHLYETNIKDIDPIEIRKQDLYDRNVDLLVVCAPCQPFSSLNKKKGGDERAGLILEALRFAKVLKPVMIFFENVPGLARFKNVLSELQTGLEKSNYQFTGPIKVDAADYGVPQRRVRCVLIATRGVSPPELPAPTTPEGSRVTVKDAIGELRPLAIGEKDPGDPIHVARKHKSITVQRLAHVPKNGGSRISLPLELTLPCHKDYDGHPDVYGRMAWDNVAPTLTTGCTDVTKGRFAHPEQNRAITMREAAILQTFPRKYVFEGKPTQIATQIGNAVPVGLVKALSPMFKETIGNIKVLNEEHGEIHGNQS